MGLFDDDKRNQTEHPFSIQNVVEVGLQVHGKLPGEWYGVCNLNEIMKTLHETYNFDSDLSDNFLGNFKVCSFKNGEIITKDVLKEGLGQKKYQELVDGKILGQSAFQAEESAFNKFQMQNNQLKDQKLEEDEQIESDFDFNLNRADLRKAQLDSINIDPVTKEQRSNQDMINEHFKNRVLI